MIIGAFLRYFKTYSGTNYIPLSSGSNFCGLVGNNGIGKSSILESFDSFFNSKPWNINTGLKKASSTTAPSHIVPIFLLRRSDIPDRHKESALALNILALRFDEKSFSTTINPSTRSLVNTFREHIQKLKRNINIDEYYIIPLGCDIYGNVSLSILNNRSLIDALALNHDSFENGRLDNVTLNDRFMGLLNFIKTEYEYIYIPKDIDPDTFTKLETSEIQKLMGESLEQIIKDKIPNETIGKINGELNSFIYEIEKELQHYSYRTSGDRQQNLKRKDIYNLIIEAFFKIRKLNKKDGANWIEISSLSSGEKQKAIIDIAHGFLTNHRENGDKLILGIDEPECSLHMSACFEQFENLYRTSKDCCQLIFTTHWYGYLPTVEHGCTTSVLKENSIHQFELYDLAGYREEIKKKVKGAKEKISYDIRLKSTNDLIQSIISSTLSDAPYNWLICEGSTEKLYLGHFLKDLVKDKKLRIVPVGGASEVKKIYQLLEVSSEDLKKEMKGKVFLLSDTDAEKLDYKVNKIDKIKCKRLLNDPKTALTTMVDVDSNKVSPATEIENCLNGYVFSETLSFFLTSHPQLGGLLNGKDFLKNSISYFSMDLRVQEERVLDDFFNGEGIKYAFAKKYVELTQEFANAEISDITIPDWVNEIKAYFS